METQVKEYYNNLKAISSIKEHIKLVRESVDETLKNELDKVEELENDNVELKNKISEKAIDKFKETGEKKLDHGLGIRESTKLIYDENEAIDWAKENMPVAIKQAIDKKQFEGYAKDKELEFVEKEEKITVTFPKELKE